MTTHPEPGRDPYIVELERVVVADLVRRAVDGDPFLPLVDEARASGIGVVTAFLAVAGMAARYRAAQEVTAASAGDVLTLAERAALAVLRRRVQVERRGVD